MSSRPGLICRECGVAVTVRKSDGAAFHADALPEGVEYHPPVPMRPEDAPEPEEPATLARRQVEALERIAAALEAALAPRGR